MTKTLRSKSILFWTRTGICTLLFSIIVVYAFVQMRDIVYGVNINANLEEYSDQGAIFNIKGVAKNATYLSLNGREISIDKNGNFTEAVSLPNGFSVITLTAKDKFGKDAEETLEIYTSENHAVALEDGVIIN